MKTQQKKARKQWFRNRPIKQKVMLVILAGFGAFALLKQHDKNQKDTNQNVKYR